ncbi:MAG: DUF1572 family protein [Cyclobacteriaceae bacterium]|nr:DUF1572 family protein [Cyclobacteriaceae bacterium]
MVLESLQSVFIRDLGKLEAELKLYPSEKSLWEIKGDIKNSAGNLCLHLCGNLQNYIGGILGKSGYIRNRDNEFAAKNIPLNQLVEEIGRAKKAIENTLPHLTKEQLESDYPEQVFGYPVKTLFFLIHLSAHLSYHLGQVNYHRRLVE